MPESIFLLNDTFLHIIEIPKLQNPVGRIDTLNFTLKKICTDFKRINSQFGIYSLVTALISFLYKNLNFFLFKKP